MNLIERLRQDVLEPTGVPNILLKKQASQIMIEAANELDAKDKRITELEAHLRNCLVLLSDTSPEERCGALRAAMEFYNHGRHEDRVEFTAEAALIELAREARELKLD